jgi:crossover junction endodeoxyribonuclease RuvC
VRILGIDPGIGRCGWGIVDYEKSKFSLVDYGCVETSAGLEVSVRLAQIYDQLKNQIEAYKPEAVAVEELFFNTNAKTAFVVGQARGAILLLAAQQKLIPAIYTPLQVKMALTGYGRAEKSQIGQMVKVLLKLSSIPKPDDAADALAIALTHAFSSKFS